MFWKYFFIIYGILCLYIGLMKPPFIFKTKKFQVLTKMLKGEKGVQILVLVFGIASLAVGIFVF